jgi:ABC-type amino acid transport substrate-binding protein
LKELRHADDTKTCIKLPEKIYNVQRSGEIDDMNFILGKSTRQTGCFYRESPMDVKERGDISRCSPIYLLNSCIGLLLIIAIIIGLCSPVYASRVVKVGLYENKPLIFTGKSGLPQGLFVDILDSIGHSEGWRIEYIPGSWVQCLKRLQNGEIDLMGSIAYSPERAKRYYFSEETVISNCGVF